jgi:WD40 repeat protein
MTFSKRLEIRGHNAAIYSILFDGEHLFSASGDKFVTKWNIISGIQEKFAIKVEDAVYKIALLNNNSILAIGTSTGKLHLVDLKTNKELKLYVQHRSAIFEIKENPQKGQFYTTDADGNFAVWSLKDLSLLLFLPLACGKIRQILPSKNGELLFLACQNEQIKVLETTYFNDISSFKGHDLAVNCLAFLDEKEETLISGGKDGHINHWDWKNERLIKSIPAHNFGIYKLLKIETSSEFISISRDKSIKVWDEKFSIVTQKIERKQGGHSHAVDDLIRISENCFATCSDDKKIILWEITPHILQHSH